MEIRWSVIALCKSSYFTYRYMQGCPTTKLDDKFCKENIQVYSGSLCLLKVLGEECHRYQSADLELFKHSTNSQIRSAYGQSGGHIV